MTQAGRAIVTSGLAATALAAQLAGLQDQGSRGLWLGYVIPLTCALLVGAYNYMGIEVVLFAAVVGIGGPALTLEFGFEGESDDAYINFGMVWWLLVPILLGCSSLGLLLRLAWDAWHDRPS
jgi:hypothetical protein